MTSCGAAVGVGFERLETHEAGVDLTLGRGARDGVLGPHGLRAWRHVTSAVRVVRFCAPGPLVSASVFVATEPLDDAGHPHTLEHIIFLGSARHPHRGYLDTLACRSLGAGTNAFTANEYTCYTSMTAGVEGMLALLPCFVDHVLRPTKTGDAAAFATEVYHCRPDGKEAGVVFSEMKARELTEQDMRDREVRCALLKNTPLACEAGGLCDAIRLLTPDAIRRYHQRYYCGSNVSIVMGASATIPDEVLLDALGPLLDEYATAHEFRLPSIAWQQPLSLEPLPELVEKRIVRFPSPDASIGSVTLAWRSPGTNDVYRARAVDVVLEYLSTLESSPLQQRFVMSDCPDATDVHFEVENYLDTSTVSLFFEGVQHLEDDDGDELDSEGQAERSMSGTTSGGAQGDSLTASPVSTALSGDTCGEPSALESGALGTAVVQFLGDFVRQQALPGGVKDVRSAIDRLIDEFLSDLESDAHSTVPDSVVCELLYGPRSSTPIGEGARGYLTSLAKLRNEKEEFWLDVIRNNLVEQPRVEVYMIPDPELAERVAREEEVAQEERRQAIKGGSLDGHVESSDGKFAHGKILGLPSLPSRPTTERIPRLPYSTMFSQAGPFFLQTVSVESGLVHASIVFSTLSLSFEQRVCLSLVAEFLLSMDLRLDDGSTISYVQNCQDLSEASVSTDNSGVWLGKFSSYSSSCIGVSYAARREKFEEATRLVLRAVYHGEVTGTRLASVAKQAESDVVEWMRDADTVRSAAAAILPRIVDGSGKNLSNAELDNLFGRERLVSFVAEEFSREKGRPRVRRKLLQMMNAVVAGIREQPSSGVFVQLGAEDPSLSRSIFEAQWADCWHPDDSSPHVHIDSHNSRDRNLPTMSDIPTPETPVRGIPYIPLSKSIGSSIELARVIGVSGAESCYLDVRVDCPVSREHAQYGCIRVLLDMLSRTEGPLYTAVRGAGLAYGVSLYMRRAQLVLSIDEASLPAEAWDAVVATLARFRDILTEGSSLSDLERDIDTAKSTILYGLVADRATPSAVLSGSLNACALCLPAGPLADRALEESIEAVDLHSVREAYDEYVQRLLQPSARLAILTCSPAVVDNAIAQFAATSSPIVFEQMDMDECVPPAVSSMVSALSR